MTPHDLSANFETLAEAPNGIQRLRELVLELAVRGKLVEQESTEKVAWEFLQGLELQRYRGTRSQSLNPQIPVLAPKDEPYPIPPSWIWTQFEFTHVNRDSERIPLSREVRSGRGGPYDYYGASGVIDNIDGYLFGKPMLLIGEDGANLVLRSTPVAFLASGKYWVNNHAHVLDSPSEISLRFLAIFINQLDLKPYLTGTAQPKLNQSKMNSIPCPFPPLAEQARIVARVDELMALLDRLEAKRQNREADRTAARDSALAALREALTPEDVETAWLRIQERFHELFAAPEDVEPLRQAVLSLAGEGRLVPQDSREDSAFDLLNQIERAHQARTKRGVTHLKNSISSHEPLGESGVLPQGWAWASIEQCCEVVGGIQKTAA
ncbi:MAG: restriction endonuclease subunit S, partial [Acidobacteriota bacterium]|nr:restriction endonuclease subunit S [Acidobacteriota bacterium]